MQASEFNIQRDRAYKQTYRRDMRRQVVRRIAHQLSTQYEILFRYPAWRRAQASPSHARPKLSTCIITMNSAQRIRPLLEYIRSFSDEIVVGVDSKTTDNTLEVCQGLADELFVIQSSAQTCNAGLETLVSRCHGDWILRLDDDEFPEPHLHTLLPGLMQDRFTHYKMPRLHLSSVEPLEWIDDGYLYPDFQLRLFKNEPSLLTFPGAVGHRGIECAGRRGRLNSVNLIHLNMAINPRFKREEKLKVYIDRLNGDWVHPVNEHALLFEDFNYRIRPYQYPDSGFCQRLIETTRHQRHWYEAQHALQQANQPPPSSQASSSSPRQ